MRLQIVVNPVAGGGRGVRALPAVTRALAHHDVVVTPTDSLEHADELSADAVADGRVVVAMGGDGLVGRVAGTVAAKDGVMGIIPGGRGNDFCRAVGIPRDPVAACRVLLSGTSRPVDLAEVDGVPYIGIASIGFDSGVQEKALTTRLRLGPLVYLYGALATVAAWQPAAFTCTVDGQPLELSGWAVAVANSGMYGGGMHLAPGASVTDGLLDVVTTGALGKVRFLRSLPLVFRGTHVHDPAVSVVQARVVTLSADRPFRVFADGDPIATLPCTIRVRPAALKVILPA